MLVCVQVHGKSVTMFIFSITYMYFSSIVFMKNELARDFFHANNFQLHMYDREIAFQLYFLVIFDMYIVLLLYSLSIYTCT